VNQILEGVKVINDDGGRLMKTKKAITLVLIAVFTLGLMGLAFAAAQDVTGTVAKIEGNKVTIADATGKETTVQVSDPKTIQDLKVGDKVKVEGGKVTKQ